MSLPAIIVVLFLHDSVQLGVVEGFNFDGVARTEIPISVESVTPFKKWVAQYVPRMPRAVSFCVVDQDYGRDDPLAEHINEFLIEREEAGEIDVYSNYKNVLSSGGQSSREVTFQTAAAYCTATVTTTRASR